MLIWASGTGRGKEGKEVRARPPAPFKAPFVAVCEMPNQLFRTDSLVPDPADSDLPNVSCLCTD